MKDLFLHALHLVVALGPSSSCHVAGAHQHDRAYHLRSSLSLDLFTKVLDIKVHHDVLVNSCGWLWCYKLLVSIVIKVIVDPLLDPH